MRKKVWVRELSSGLEYEVDASYRVAPAPGDLDVQRKGATVIQDDGAFIKFATEAKRWEAESSEIGQFKKGERVLAKIGPNLPLGGVFWPIFEVLR